MSQCCCLSPQEERLQGTKKVNRQGRERVYKILDRIQFTVPHVDIERARYFTESMRQTEGELLTLRWAKALKWLKRFPYTSRPTSFSRAA